MNSPNFADLFGTINASWKKNPRPQILRLVFFGTVQKLHMSFFFAHFENHASLASPSTIKTAYDPLILMFG
jgi:hypothetical protein